MKYLRGKGLRVKKADNTALIPKETNCSLSIGSSLQDDSTKDDQEEEWDNQSINERNWSCKADALVDDNGANVAALLIAWIDSSDDAPVSVKFACGQQVFTGSALLTGLDITATVKQNVSVSASYTGVGALTTT